MWRESGSREEALRCVDWELRFLPIVFLWPCKVSRGARLVLNIVSCDFCNAFTDRARSTPVFAVAVILCDTGVSGSAGLHEIGDASRHFILSVYERPCESV